MATIKSFTDISQSKTLSKILPLESADMVLLHEEPYETSDSKFDGLHQALCVPFSKYDKTWRQKYKNIHYFPCWSLAVLLGVLPEIQGDKPAISLYDNYITYPHMSDLHTKADNIVDACVAMIEKLNELNLL